MVGATPSSLDRIVDRAGLNGAAPGLVVVAALVAAAFGINALSDRVSTLVVALVLGAALANLGLLDDRLAPGLRFASKQMLRTGIVLLGFRLALDDVGQIGGPPGIVVVIVVVILTFVGTRLLAERLGVSGPLGLLVATGFSICGASAIAAMRPLSDADDEEVGYAIGLVTLYGTLAVVALPLLDRLVLGLGDEAFGWWSGASVHDVAQVVATASTRSETALETAVVVKLSRVVLLAPMLVAVSVSRRNRRPDTDPGARPPLIPLFVLGFLAAAAIRTSGVLGDGELDAIKQAETVLLAAAMVGLGAGIRLTDLRRLGGRPLVLGGVSWVLIAVVSYVGVLLVQP